MTKEPTEEQQAILDCDGNIVVTAKPGSGKTYTVVEKISAIIDGLYGHQGIIAISYTNKASDELKDRCRQKGIDFKRAFFGTIDKFYITQIIIPFAGHLTNKMPDYQVLQLEKTNPVYGRLANIDTFGQSEEELVKKALQEGKVFLELSGQIALYLINNVPGVLQYLKARYTDIFIDEYQDCGSVQHAVFMKMVKSGIRGTAVGDKDQAIFAFSHRYPKYLLSLIEEPEFSHFELTINHRCHPSIVEYSRCLMGDAGIVPKEKRVFKVNVAGDEAAISSQIDLHLEAIKNYYGVQDNNRIAVLCKSNGTLGKVNESLMTPHKLFKETELDRDNSEWGRIFRDLLIWYFSPDIYAVDIARELFYEELEPQKYRSALRILDTLFNLEEERLVEGIQYFVNIAELVYPGRKNKNAIHALDTVLSEKAIYSNYIPALPEEINLLTLHKSKGLEFNIVFHFDLYEKSFPFRMDTQSEYVQDLNLHYVGVTRAIDACFFMQGTKRYVNKYDTYYTAKDSPFLYIRGLPQRRMELNW